jgi:ABC-type dipeptide/oligopeptide/nickel transport system ATPase component
MVSLFFYIFVLPVFLNRLIRMSDNLLLEIKKLSVVFSNGKTINTAVDAISFRLNQNETLAIVGESGSGKSVTALSIMQLLPIPPGKITNGEINYYSEKGKVNFVKLSDKNMCQYRGKDVGMVFQEPMTSLNPVRRCGSQLMESRLVHQ